MSSALWLLLALRPMSFGQAAESKSIGIKPLITDVAGILALPRAAAAGNSPVKISGVITCFQPRIDLCFVQDASAGIYVYGVDPKLELSAGSLVEISGVTDAGRYSPIIKEVSVRRLGQTNLPPAKPITVDDLRAGTEDAQWIQLRGVVVQARQSPGYSVLEIVAGGSRFQAQILEPMAGGVSNLVDALVSVQGVAGAAFDAQGKVSGFNVFVPSEKFVEVVRRGATGPFESPRLTVAELAQYAHRRLQPHRVLVQGTVTAQRDKGFFYLRDATGSIEIQPGQAGAVSPGDIVEAAGFPGDDLRRPVLREAVFRKTGAGTIQSPITVSSTQWQGDGLENELITFEGTLLGSTRSSSNQITSLVSSGDQNLTVTAERAEGIPDLARISPGSILRLTGICQHPDPDSSLSHSIQVWLPSAEQVEVIRTVHSWTAAEVWFLAGLAFLIPVAGFWLVRRAENRRSGRGPTTVDGDQDAARRYHELFENASDVICTMEPTGRITSLNRSGVALLGYSETEARGLNISQLVVPSDWPRLRPLLEAKEGDQTVASGEFELVARDGRHIFLQINARSVGQKNQFLGVQAIARDVTERKRTETELVRTAEGLQFSLAERERIGRDLHDSIIQSIYAVGLTLDECRRNLKNAPEKAELRLDQGIEALNGLIREVRNYIEGSGPVMLQAHELEGALKSLVLTMGSARTVRFSLAIEPGVTDLLQARQATEIFLIARELMGNCLRHSRASSARISIRAGRDCVILRIEDDGAGFDVDARSPAGRGLRNISGRARDLAAEFQIESNPGAGSVFTLEVPVTKPQYRNEIKNPPTPAGG